MLYDELKKFWHVGGSALGDNGVLIEIRYLRINKDGLAEFLECIKRITPDDIRRDFRILEQLWRIPSWLLGHSFNHNLTEDDRQYLRALSAEIKSEFRRIFSTGDITSRR